MINQLKVDLEKLANPQKAKEWSRYYKMAPGKYGEGQVLLGISMPAKRKLAKKYLKLPLDQIQELIESNIHGYKVMALIILVHRYKKHKDEIFNFYLKNTKNINNWGLVDISAYQIIGDYLLDKPRDIIYNLARSDNLWEKRIAIVSTFAFIRQNQFDDTIKLAEMLLHDKHDLIHKAVGWMLREVGKKDQAVLEAFLEKHCKEMPRTMLRYSIEKFSPEKRQYYMKR